MNNKNGLNSDDISREELMKMIGLNPETGNTIFYDKYLNKPISAIKLKIKLFNDKINKILGW